METYILKIKQEHTHQIIYKAVDAESETGAIIDYHKWAPDTHKVIAVSNANFREI